jgi:hypothetical protein
MEKRKAIARIRYEPETVQPVKGRYTSHDISAPTVTNRNFLQRI